MREYRELEAGLYGSSFRGTFENESFDRYPERSAHNPDQLPERTVRVVDFGPCPFPAYVGATAGTRSLTAHGPPPPQAVGALTYAPVVAMFPSMLEHDRKEISDG